MKTNYLSKALLLFCLITIVCSCENQKRYWKCEGFTQGSTWHITFSSTENRRTIDKITTGIDSILLGIDNSISGYNQSSLLSRFNAGEEIVPDKHFGTLLVLSTELVEQTEGKFDPSAAPLFDLWGFGFSNDSTIPSKAAIDSSLSLVGLNHYSIDENGILRRDNSGCKLNFNAIAQGYTCDVLAKYLNNNGSTDYLIEIGGEIVCKGLKANGTEWNIICDAPDASSDTLHLSDCAIVTSGNYHKNTVDSTGHHIGHIIDPRTGIPTQNISSSRTIIVKFEDSAWPCSVADAMATAAMIE